MLSHLTIRSLAVIDSLELGCATGMTALTGETGAGKSILVDALGLLLGARAGADMIRAGTERADVCGVFETDANAPARAWLAERELDDGAGECIVRRVIGPGSRSRAFVNDRPVPAQTLRELGEHLVGHPRPARAPPAARPGSPAAPSRRLRRPPRTARPGRGDVRTVAGAPARAGRARRARYGPRLPARLPALPARRARRSGDRPGRARAARGRAAPARERRLDPRRLPPDAGAARRRWRALRGEPVRRGPPGSRSGGASRPARR